MDAIRRRSLLVGLVVLLAGSLSARAAAIPALTVLPQRGPARDDLHAHRERPEGAGDGRPRGLHPRAQPGGRGNQLACPEDRVRPGSARG